MQSTSSWVYIQILISAFLSFRTDPSDLPKCLGVGKFGIVISYQIYITITVINEHIYKFWGYFRLRLLEYYRIEDCCLDIGIIIPESLHFWLVIFAMIASVFMYNLTVLIKF